jgi:hypothetical protein
MSLEFAATIDAVSSYKGSNSLQTAHLPFVLTSRLQRPFKNEHSPRREKLDHDGIV